MKSIFKKYLEDTILSEYLQVSEYLQDTFEKYLAQHWRCDDRVYFSLERRTPIREESCKRKRHQHSANSRLYGRRSLMLAGGWSLPLTSSKLRLYARHMLNLLMAYRTRIADSQPQKYNARCSGL